MITSHLSKITLEQIEAWVDEFDKVDEGGLYYRNGVAAIELLTKIIDAMREEVGTKD